MMSCQQEPFSTAEAEYDAIQAALMATARGRRFLAEHARRHRSTETRTLLDAIGRLEQAVLGGRAAVGAGPVSPLVADATFSSPPLPRSPTLPTPPTAEPGSGGVTSIARARRDIAALRAAELGPPPPEPEQAFEAVAEGAARAAASILEAAAEMDDLALALRASGGEAWLSAEITRCAATVAAAGAEQDFSARQVDRLVRTLHEVERRRPSKGRSQPILAVVREVAASAAAAVKPGLDDADDLFLPPGEEAAGHPAATEPALAKPVLASPVLASPVLARPADADILDLRGRPRLQP